MKRIHIVGCGPRSGTTLLTELMSTCFEIDLFTEHEDSIYTLPPRKCDIYLTKSPSDILRVGPILERMANLYVIYLVRDPRDMIVSRHNRDPSRYWSGLRFWRTNTPYGRALEPHPRFVTVRYEDLVNTPNQVQDLLTERFPFLKKKADFSRYHELAKPSKRSLEALREVRPISSSSIGNWRNHLPRVAGQLQQYGSITDDLVFYGYAENADWEKVLAGIEPDLSPSFWPESSQPGGAPKTERFAKLKATYVVLAHSRAHGLLRVIVLSYRFIRRTFRSIRKFTAKFFQRSMKFILPAFVPAVPLPVGKKPISRQLIIKPDMLPGDDGANMNMPSLLRVPDWVVQPLGRYYLYFACHTKSGYIRLAVADHIEGPWRIHKAGALHASDASGIGDFVYAPDVHVDHDKKQIRLYFHSTVGSKKTLCAFVATSQNGLNFDVPARLADTFYFRAFSYRGAWYGVSKGGRLFRSSDGLSPFETGPDLFPTIPGNCGNYDAAGSIRHVSVEVFEKHAEIYYTRIGDAPEIILKSRIELGGNWRDWRAGAPQEVMRSEEEWEGAKVPVKPSVFGKTTEPVHQLRDPAVFRDADGARYLVYAAAGEHAIGLARLDAE